AFAPSPFHSFLRSNEPTSSCPSQRSPRPRRAPRKPSLRPPAKAARSAESPGRRATPSTCTKS
ncbi:hypothetical protein DPEC_G00377050, partial [Dallia pectoralis]